MIFEIEQLAKLLKENCPKIDMAFLHGSAKDGIAGPNSDIDLALFIKGKPTWELYQQVENLVESIAPGTPCDIGILNDTEPVYRFEALRGTYSSPAIRNNTSLSSLSPAASMNTKSPTISDKNTTD